MIIFAEMKKILLTLLLIVTATSLHAAPKHEMRGVWVATVWGIDWPAVQGTSASVRERQQRDLKNMLDLYSRLNLTTVIFQVRSMADAMYSSKLEPWSRFISGRRGDDPGWDPLEWMTEECHKRGLECYAWVNPFRTGKGKDFTTGFDRRIADKGWLLTFGDYTVMNPGLEEVRSHIVDVCRDIVTRYDIDGLIFDDYFYPNRIPDGESAPDYELYSRSGSPMTLAEWRRANVHKLVSDVSSMIFDRRPDVRFGISPAGVAGRHDTSARKWGITPVDVPAADWQWNEIYSDPLGWIYQGTVDFVSPQLYWPTNHTRAPYLPLARWWDYAAMRGQRQSFPSISLADLDKGDDPSLIADHLEQLAATRDHVTPGVIFYSAKFIPRISTALTSSEHFATKAISPAANWKYPHFYTAPYGLKLTGNKLHWNPVAPDSDGAIVRYAVYAWPAHISGEEAADAETDSGFASEYLLGITYSPEFTLPENLLHGMTFAVTVVDGNSVEYPASILR